MEERKLKRMEDKALHASEREERVRKEKRKGSDWKSRKDLAGISEEIE